MVNIPIFKIPLNIKKLVNVFKIENQQSVPVNVKRLIKKHLNKKLVK